MTCCIGKARIFYKEPIGFQLKYSGSANGSVLASEPLTTTCEADLSLGVYYVLSGTHTYTTRRNGYNITNTLPFSSGYYGPININITYQSLDNITYGYLCTVKEGNPSLFGFYDSFTVNGVTLDSYTLNITSEATKIFKVIGEETGTVYREISGLEECPEVNNLGCVMGEEKYVDTYMGGINGKLLRFIPGFAKIPILTEYKECIKTKKTNNLFGNPVLNVLKYLEADIVDIGWKDIGFESGILSIPIIEGCPDPPVRVVCCPDGDCDPKERCPPDTDCSLDCGDFVCCYKNGKVIKTVRK
jgi:hypothetical protein